ncbi:MAG: LytR C-terminal domain-containing protein [Patescibacteria group bacterium]|nr:LytR C-terminal domain-containing protein [Patescibacteria group bacterium]
MSARRRKKKPLKVVLSKVGKMCRFITLALIGLAMMLVIAWLLLPYVFGLSSTSNYIFEPESVGADLEEIYLVSFQPKSGAVHFQPISLDMEIELFFDEEIEKRRIKDWLSWFADKNQNLNKDKIYSWLLKNNIRQVIHYSGQELTQPTDILSIIRAEIFNNKLSIKDRQSLFELFAFAKNAEFSQHKSAQNINDIAFPLLDNGHCSVAVINTTIISGLAGEVGDSFEKMGVRVIRIDGDDSNLQQTQIIITNKDSCQSTATSISRILMGTVGRGEDQEKKQLLSRYRADLVLLLGADQSLSD